MMDDKLDECELNPSLIGTKTYEMLTRRNVTFTGGFARYDANDLC